MQAKDVKRLDPRVVEGVRSSFTIASQQQAIEELILNSIDAGADTIDIAVDASCCSFEVRDNGKGMDKDDLEIVGDRYATSKCGMLEDLEKITTYGFRGEALSSICKLGIVEITTRTASSPATLSKLIQAGQTVSMGVAEQHKNVGTTIKVRDLFFTLPVRRKNLVASVELEKIKQRIERIALIHPGISFSLYDTQKGARVLQTRKLKSLLSGFIQLFGSSKASGLKEVSLSHQTKYSFEGILSLPAGGYHSKELQFFYLNSRYVTRTRFHKLINDVYNKVLAAMKLDQQYRAPLSWFPSGDARMVAMRLRTGNVAPKKVFNKHPIFVINLVCPPEDYDITTDPTKTLVEFKNWDRVINALSELLGNFFHELGITYDGITPRKEKGGDGSGSQDSFDEDSYRAMDDSEESEASPQGGGLGMYSYTAKRKQPFKSGKKRKQMSILSRPLPSDLPTGEEEEEKEEEGGGGQPMRDTRSYASHDDDVGDNDDDDVIILDGPIRQPDVESTAALLPKEEIKQERTGEEGEEGGEPLRQPTEDDEDSTEEIIDKFALARAVRKRKLEALQRSSGESCESTTGHTTGFTLASTKSTTTTTPPPKKSILYGDSIRHVSPLSVAKHSEPVKKRRRCSSGPPFGTASTTLGGVHYNPPTSLNSMAGGIKHEIIDVDTNEVEVIVTPLILQSPAKYLRIKKEEENGVEKESSSEREESGEKKDKGKEKVKEEEIVEQKDAMVMENREEDDGREAEEELRKYWEERRKNEWHNRPAMTTSIQRLFEGQKFGELSSRKDKILELASLHPSGVARGMPSAVTKETIKQMRVINQLDYKFLLTEENGVLYILDQHAVDERVGLETLQKHVLGADGLERNVQAHPVSLHFKATPHECKLLELYTAQVTAWKFTFTLPSDIEPDGNLTVRLHTVPSVHGTALTNPNGLKEFLHQLETTSGSSVTKPKAVLRLLQSKACRGAIMFGDPLTYEQCESLLQAVSKCDLPFQCAHGRPSVVPLVNYTNIPKQPPPVKRRPNVKKIGEITKAFKAEEEAKVKKEEL